MLLTKPETPVRESLSARLLRARTTRDFATAEELSLQLLRKDPGREAVRRGWARTLVALRRESEARAHWWALREANARDLEAVHNTVHGARHRAHEFRHVAICGVSFCGSTVMDRLLGGLPGAASICESHWLTQTRSHMGTAPIEFDQPDAAIHHCTRCGPRCAVLNADFRRDLARDAADWHAKIAGRLDTSILISADKNATKLVDLDPLLRLDALVLFKSPAQAWMSARRRLPEGRDEKFYSDACAGYLTRWADRYSIFLDHFRPQGKILFLHFDDFARDPETLLQQVCDALDLAYGASAFDAPRQGHPIGGNELYADRERIRIAPLSVPDCPAEERQSIARAEGAQAVFRRLLERCEI